MPIHYHEQSRTFHLQNDSVSYIIKILNEGMPVCLYFGERLHDRNSFDHLMERVHRPMSVTWDPDDLSFSEEHIRHEYPVPFHGDMRNGAIDLLQPDGSRIMEFVFEDFKITRGKQKIEGLPACYVEDEKEAESLELIFCDKKLELYLHLYYTIYEDRPVICRHASIENHSLNEYRLERMMSLSIDLADDEYQQLTLAGAWARERNIKIQDLHPGIQSIYSLRGHSSHNFNPFLCLKRKETTEKSGECYGFSLVYSGNFLAETDVNTWHATRVSIGIHPQYFLMAA